MWFGQGSRRQGMALPEIGSLVLVTGASGFIATHVIQQLLQAGYRVRGSLRNLTDTTKLQALHQLYPNSKHPLDLVQADLTDQESWISAVEGCQYVIHVASPFPAVSPRNEEDVTRPAIDGTVNVLKACRKAGTVKRVVLTSSMAAIAYGHSSNEQTPLTETDWTDTSKSGIDAYIKSKTLAEQRAWDFVAGLPEDESFELSVINPSLVLGPVLCKLSATSVDIPRKLLERKIPMLPRINLGVVDVRDVAHAHLKAMVLPEAAGKRHIVCKQNLWCVELARVIHTEFKPQGYNVPVKVAPDFVLKIAGLFDRSVRKAATAIGKKRECDNSRMKSVLGVMPRDIRDTIIDMCYSLIEFGIVERKPGYKGPPPIGAEIRFQHSFDED